MDSIVRFLTSCSPTHRQKSFLEDLGKTAAVKMVESEADMNTTIAGLVKENSLNREQTKRVVEAANNVAFNLLMKKEAGYITFEVADSKKCGGGKVKTKLARANYIPGEEFITTEKLASAFFGTATEEEEHLPKENPIATRQKLAHLLDSLEDTKTRALTKVAELQAYVAEAVQTGELLIDDIEQVLASSGVSPEFVKVACARTDVCRGTGASTPRLVNQRHPLLIKAAACKKATADYITKKRETTGKVKELLHGAK
jgi:hypothetical protein